MNLSEKDLKRIIKSNESKLEESRKNSTALDDFLFVKKYFPNAKISVTGKKKETKEKNESKRLSFSLGNQYV